MSWVSGIKEIKLLGLRSVKLTVPKTDLEWYGCFYPLAIDNKQVIDAVFADVGAEKLLGKGNYNIFASELDDFNFESLVWPSFWSDYDDAVLDADTDMNILYGFMSLDILTENEYTSVETSYRNIITLVAYTDNTSSGKQMRISLGGFYSPVQDLIFTNFNEQYKDTLFHEATHALTRSAEDLLRYVMYGGSESSVKEEIMTHLVTDKFKSFKALESFINDSISVEYETVGNWKKPISFRVSSSKVLDVSNATDKASLLRAQAVMRNQVTKLSGVKNGMVTRNGMKALRKIQFGSDKIPQDKNKYKSSLGSKTNARRRDVIDHIKSTRMIGKSRMINHSFLKE